MGLDRRGRPRGNPPPHGWRPGSTGPPRNPPSYAVRDYLPGDNVMRIDIANEQVVWLSLPPENAHVLYDMEMKYCNIVMSHSTDDEERDVASIIMDRYLGGRELDQAMKSTQLDVLGMSARQQTEKDRSIVARVNPPIMGNVKEVVASHRKELQHVVDKGYKYTGQDKTINAGEKLRRILFTANEIVQREGYDIQAAFNLLRPLFDGTALSLLDIYAHQNELAGFYNQIQNLSALFLNPNEIQGKLNQIKTTPIKAGGISAVIAEIQVYSRFLIDKQLSQEEQQYQLEFATKAHLDDIITTHYLAQQGMVEQYVNNLRADYDAELQANRLRGDYMWERENRFSIVNAMTDAMIRFCAMESKMNVAKFAPISKKEMYGADGGVQSTRPDNRFDRSRRQVHALSNRPAYQKSSKNYADSSDSSSDEENRQSEESSDGEARQVNAMARDAKAGSPPCSLCGKKHGGSICIIYRRTSKRPCKVCKENGKTLFHYDEDCAQHLTIYEAIAKNQRELLRSSKQGQPGLMKKRDQTGHRDTHFTNKRKPRVNALDAAPAKQEDNASEVSFDVVGDEEDLLKVALDQDIPKPDGESDED